MLEVDAPPRARGVPPERVWFAILGWEEGPVYFQQFGAGGRRPSHNRHGTKAWGGEVIPPQGEKNRTNPGGYLPTAIR